MDQQRIISGIRAHINDDQYPRLIIDAVHGAALSKRFFDEVMFEVGSFGEVVDNYGQATMLDCAYLQAVLLNPDGFIDYCERESDDQSKIVELINTLPSKDLWMARVRMADMIETPVMLSA